MRAKIVTTVTTLFNVDTMEQEVEVDVSDEDGLSNVSSQVLGSVLIGSMRSVERGLREQFRIPDRVGQDKHTRGTADALAARQAQRDKGYTLDHDLAQAHTPADLLGFANVRWEGEPGRDELVRLAACTLAALDMYDHLDSVTGSK